MGVGSVGSNPSLPPVSGGSDPGVVSSSFSFSADVIEPPTQSATRISFTSDDVSKIALPSGSLSWSLLLKILGDAKVNLSAQIQENLAQSLAFSAEFFKYLGTAAVDLIALFNDEEAVFLGQTFNEDETGPRIVALNAASTNVQNDITIQQNAQVAMQNATTTYNAAVTAFNAAVASGFSGTTEAQALATYNAARAAYNLALNTYHSTTAVIAGHVTAYNNAVTDYVDYVNNVVNPGIDALNEERAEQDLPPIPHQVIDPSVVTITFNVSDSLTLLSPASLSTASTQPTRAAPPTTSYPGTIAAQLVDPRSLALEDAVSGYLAQAAPLLAVFVAQQQILGEKADKNNLTAAEYKQAVRLISASYIEPNAQQVNVARGGPGGIGMAPYAMGLGNQAVSSVMSRSVLNQIFTNEKLEPPPNIFDKLLTLTLVSTIQSGVLSSLPGLAFIADNITQIGATNPAVGISNSLGLNFTFIGLLNNGGLRSALNDILGGEPSLAGLSPDQREELVSSLAAFTTNSLLQLGVGSLANQLGLPSVNEALKVAQLAANPNENGTQFSLQQQQFQGLVDRYGSSQVAVPLNQVLTASLTGQGVEAGAAQRAGKALSDQLSQQGLGESPASLQSAIRSILTDELGNESAAALSGSLFAASVSFSASAALKEEVQSRLIQSSGASQALSLTEPVVNALYGFSVDFSQSAVSFQRQVEGRPTSIVALATDQNRQLLKSADQASLTDSLENFRQSQLISTSLASFLEKAIDPGHQMFGLMNKIGGTKFERGRIDIDVA